mmetsp:Transcript_45768/g.83920  ORF Transcript_45768/g.83920 Transcript_45768/m.83920 type:complete len:223 (+) Transcript_45768:497-1165(+)
MAPASCGKHTPMMFSRDSLDVVKPNLGRMHTQQPIAKAPLAGLSEVRGHETYAGVLHISVQIQCSFAAFSPRAHRFEVASPCRGPPSALVAVDGDSTRGWDYFRHRSRWPHHPHCLRHQNLSCNQVHAHPPPTHPRLPQTQAAAAASASRAAAARPALPAARPAPEPTDLRPRYLQTWPCLRLLLPNEPCGLGATACQARSRCPAPAQRCREASRIAAHSAC